MKLFVKYKSRIGSWLMLSLILQTTSPLVAALPLQPDVMQEKECIIDSTVNAVITHLVEDAVHAGVEAGLADATKRCYKKLAEGQEALPVADVWDAMPDMLRHTVEKMRAARPSAAPSPVVGPGNCEVTQLIAIIKSIRSRIGSVCNNACNNTILGILGNARDILGVNISCALEDLVFTDSLILERLEELEATLTACCNGLQIEIDELDLQIAGCCETVIEDILDGREEILDKISTLTGASTCCDCDFFITQVANGEPDNHPINTPITIPGIYCLAESVTGTIEIQASNVTVLFRDHTLTPDQTTGYGVRLAGDVSAPFNNIRIEGGTIQGAAVAQPPLDIQNCMGLQIVDMAFVGNALSNLQLVNVDNFVIQNCQYVQSAQFAMVLVNCTSGRILQCVVREFTFEGAINYIVLSGCRQILVEDVVITNNTATNMPVVFLNGSHDCTLRNIRITNNSTTAEFRGIDLTNSSENIIEQCSITNNQIATLPGDVGVFSGIRIRGLTANNSNNNIICNSRINDNAIAPGVGGFGDVSHKITRALTGANVFVGIDIGEESQTDSCQNTVIENCTVNGNSAIGELDSGFNVTSLMIGVNVASILGTRIFSVGNNVGANTVIRNCTVDHNTASTHFVGVNVASVLLGSPSPSLGANIGQNSVIEYCTVNNNSITGSVATGLGYFFVGFSLGNILATDTATIGDYCATGCSIAHCSTNNNDVAASLSSTLQFSGILLASSMISVSTTLGEAVCSNCSINDCTVNSNTCASGAVFNGIGVARCSGLFVALASTATIGTHAGSNCIVNNCSVDNNSFIGNAAGPLHFLGIDFGGIFANAGSTSTVQDGACASSAISNVTVNNNTIKNGVCVGINLAGTYFPQDALAVTVGAGVCDNCTVRGYAMNGNTSNHVNGAAPIAFFGINVGANHRLGTIGGGAVSNGSCNNCVISEASISSNQFVVTPVGAPDRFFGVGFGYTPDDTPRSGNSCNNCVLENVRVSRNTVRADNIGAVMRGFSFGSNNTPSASLCNNIIATRCLVENSDFAANAGPGTGNFVGFYATAADASPVATALCNNLAFKQCEVNSNTAPTGSYGYSFVSAGSLGAYINNAYLQGCVAKQNANMVGLGFDNLRYLTVDGCVSNQNFDGFVFNFGSDVVVQNCVGIGNNDPNLSGGAFVANSLNDAIFLNNKAFNNVMGFSTGFGAPTSTTIMMRNNVAQNNTAYGFWGSPTENTRNFHNFAQGNGTNYFNVNGFLLLTIAGLQASIPNPFGNVDIS